MCLNSSEMANSKKALLRCIFEEDEAVLVMGVPAVPLGAAWVPWNTLGIYNALFFLSSKSPSLPLLLLTSKSYFLSYSPKTNTHLGICRLRRIL